MAQPIAETVVSDVTRQRWIIITIAFAAFMAKLDSSIVNISLPAITRYFATGTTQASWIVLSYLLLQTTTMVISGKIADIIGLRRTFALGYLIFIVGSLFCTMSPGIGTLIASRCLQGIGTAMMIAAAFAAVPTFLPPDMNGSAFGFAGTSAGLGVIVGAPLGGIITGLASWHWVFLINVPMGIAAIVVAWKAIPDEKIVFGAHGTQFDLPGGFLCFSGLFGLVYGLNRGQEWGWSSLPVAAILGAGLLFLGGFYLRERRSPDPVLDLRLFSDRRFLFATGAGFTAYVIMSGTNFLLPFYLETMKGLRTEQAGMVLLSFSVVYVFGGFFAGRLSDRINPGILCVLAMTSMVPCYLVFALTLRHPGLLPAFVFLVWFALSLALFASPNNNQAMKYTPEHEKGVASGVFNTVTSLGLVFGVSVFETIFSAARFAGSAADGGRSAAGVGFQHAFLVASCIAALGLFFSVMVYINGRKAQHG